MEKTCRDLDEPGSLQFSPRQSTSIAPQAGRVILGVFSQNNTLMGMQVYRKSRIRFAGSLVPLLLTCPGKSSGGKEVQENDQELPSQAFRNYPRGASSASHGPCANGRARGRTNGRSCGVCYQLISQFFGTRARCKERGDATRSYPAHPRTIAPAHR